MYQALKSAKNGRSWESLAGYSCTDLVQHLEGQFKAGMSWDNYGKSKGEWSIDHILPRSLFKYDTAESAAFRACWALDNLRPLWAEENSSKGATLELTA